MNVIVAVYGQKSLSIDTDTNVYFMRQFQCLPTTYVIENKETHFEIYITLIKNHVH